MSRLERQAWIRLALCTLTFGWLVVQALGSDPSVAWKASADAMLAFAGIYVVLGGATGWSRRRSGEVEDERDLAIARRARGFALFALCFAAFWLAMVLGDREWSSGGPALRTVAQLVFMTIPFALCIEAAVCAVLYWQDRRGLA